MINAVLKIVFFALLASANPAFASVVKMSNSGICHPPQSSWYDRTKTFQPFNSVKECLASGGRLPKGMARPSVNDRRVIKSSDSESYSRSAFATDGMMQMVIARTVGQKRLFRCHQHRSDLQQIDAAES
ncbi:hypothetical protein [Marinobacter adhaerens]|uniref:hypothetical protein n=1 Tax=Marinobacter adhaerens TaxID=1033846 RepID=UPI001E2CA864|nr:hypothetical protein [Marinobacter adhaerens]